MNRIELEKILNESDSPKKYKPEGFDVIYEYERVKKVGMSINRMAPSKGIVEDPSLFQDGSIFTRIVFSGEGVSAVPEQQIVISSFGELFSVINFDDHSLANALVELMSINGYKGLPFDALDFQYSGRYKIFKNLSWKERFFSSFYDPLDFR